MKNKRILFEIAHPKHFHQFKGLIQRLGEENEIHIIARHKDVVVDLLEAHGLTYQTYGAHGKNLKEKIALIARILKDYRAICKTFRPDLVISKSSPYAAIAGKMMGFKTCIMNDSEVVMLTNKFVAPLTSLMVTPVTFPKTKSKKHVHVNGLFEEAYLSPEVFQPDASVLNTMGLESNAPYAVLRFVGWFANHDVGKAGFTLENKIELCALLEKKMRVFISHEGSLPKELTRYKLPTAPDKVHSVLHYASLYIGDSQTMATEAALLGTPSIRFNSFVGDGDMANFKFLEQQKMLTNSASFEAVLNAVERLSDEGSKSAAMDLRKKYFSSKKFVDDEIIEALEGLVVG